MFQSMYRGNATNNIMTVFGQAAEGIKYARTSKVAARVFIQECSAALGALHKLAKPYKVGAAQGLSADDIELLNDIRSTLRGLFCEIKTGEGIEPAVLDTKEEANRLIRLTALEVVHDLEAWINSADIA